MYVPWAHFRALMDHLALLIISFDYTKLLMAVLMCGIGTPQCCS